MSVHCDCRRYFFFRGGSDLCLTAPISVWCPCIDCRRYYFRSCRLQSLSGVRSKKVTTVTNGRLLSSTCMTNTVQRSPEHGTATQKGHVLTLRLIAREEERKCGGGWCVCVCLLCVSVFYRHAADSVTLFYREVEHVWRPGDVPIRTRSFQLAVSIFLRSLCLQL